MYTKGEWKVYWERPDAKDNSDCRIITDGGEVAIMLAPDLNECKANAHLIAAAPELYEALGALVAAYVDEGLLAERAEQALAKAEGKE